MNYEQEQIILNQANSHITQLWQELLELADKDRAVNSLRFFKTGQGQYGEGDKFLGIDVPTIHKLSKKYKSLNLDNISALLRSPFHEVRLLSLFFLIIHYDAGDRITKSKIASLYLLNISYINNWDLVDASAHKILGDYLVNKDRSILNRLAISQNMWERRIAIVATYKFIKAGSFVETLRISEKLLNDKEDLIHKAVGWMLREVGKKNNTVEKSFLDKHAASMPRTMLRYAIEKFPEQSRKKYLRLISKA